jgi:hypothetical protein
LEQVGLTVRDGVPVREDQPDAALVSGIVVLGVVSTLVIGRFLRGRWAKLQRSTGVGEKKSAAITPRATTGTQGRGYLAVGMVVGALIVGASIAWGAGVLERSIRCAGYLASETGGESALRVLAGTRDDYMTLAAHTTLIALGCPIVRPNNRS